MNKEYAEKNGLRIGDKIKNANLSGEQKVIVEYEIIGLFDIQADKTDEKNNYNAASYYDYSQYAFLSMPAYKEATIHYPDGPSAGYTDADFFVEDPEQLEKIIQNVQSISSINWNNFLIQVNDEVYERVADSVSDMNSLVFTLVVLLLTVSVLIIVLLLSMWIRNRKHEIGIMLAVGITKPTILLQHILEILLIAAAAFPSSYPIARNIAGNIGKLFGKPATNIHVTQQHFVIVTVLGTLLIILAVITACIPIIKYRPKEILTQME